MVAETPDGSEPLPPRPLLPRDEDCCRSDCPNCVFNLHDRELERWQEQVAEILARRAAREGRQA